MKHSYDGPSKSGSTKSGSAPSTIPSKKGGPGTLGRSTGSEKSEVSALQKIHLTMNDAASQKKAVKSLMGEDFPETDCPMGV